MHRGRVRGIAGDGRTRTELVRARFAASPAGTITDFKGLSTLRWTECALPATAAGVLRATGAWDLDQRHDFDGEDWWWRIALDSAQAGDRLDFGGIATLWDAWLDGNWIGQGDSMFAPRVIELDAPAKELVIRTRSLTAELGKKRPRPRWRVPMLEHAQLRWFRTTLLGRTPGWSPACPAVGPWRPIVHERGGLRIGTVSVDARVEAGVGFFTVGAQLASGVERAVLVVTRGDSRSEHPLENVMGSWNATVPVMQPALWWPHTHGEPALYRLAIEARAGERAVTIDLGTSGFRTIHVERDGGDFRVLVNGVPVFCRGACWTPLDPVTLRAPREAYAAAIAQMRGAGMNMLRIGGTMIYEDDALYDALDEQGVLLWQDLMFANMDYPDDPKFVLAATAEVDTELARLAGRPSLAVICGNSEVQQQAAMAGASRDRWAPALFHETLAARARALAPRVAYVASSTDGGAFPHAPNTGVASYYGVGAYMRPLEDARRSEVKFASECLAFANIPVDVAWKAHDPRWKAGSPRDLGAGWDFDDIRDHYLKVLFGVDPMALRSIDHERYLALGRVATGEVMERTFLEWRRARSVTRGGLVWFLRDLRPGAGWGVVDSTGVPKPAYFAMRRALAPLAVGATDEGSNGLAIHAFNDGPEAWTGELAVVLIRGQVSVGTMSTPIEIPAHGARELWAAELFEGWMDLACAYRFGPPVADAIHLVLQRAGKPEAESWYMPAGLASTREPDVGLSVEARDDVLAVTAQRFAQFVTIEGKGFTVADNYFHLGPAQTRAVRFHKTGPVKGTLTAGNSERTVRFELP